MRRLIFALGVLLGLTALLSAGSTLLARTAGVQAQPLSINSSVKSQVGSVETHGDASVPAITNVCTYAVSQSTGTLVPGTSDIGNHCFVACTTPIDLPFSYQLYDMTFTSANVGST